MNDPKSATPASSTAARKPLLEALSGRSLRPPPIWLMRQAGRYLPEYREIRAGVGGFLELCYTPQLAVEVTLQPIRRYGFDAAILFSDILVVPDALGQNVRFEEGEGPRLDAVTDVQALSGLGMDGFHEHLAPVYETVQQLADALPDAVALIGFAGAPWTVATYMVEGGSSRDFARVRRWGLEDPQGFSRLLELVTAATAEYLTRQVQAGAQVLQLFDSWAGVLSEAEFRRWVIAPTKRIVAAVKAKYPELPIIGFPRGAGVLYEAYVEETGIDAVSLDSTVPVRWAQQHLQPSVTVQGNLDPLLLLAGGDAMESAVETIIAELADGPLIFNLGHGIIKETPPEHVSRLLDLVRNGRR